MDDETSPETTPPPVLQVTFGETSTAYRLDQPVITIGRASDNTIVIPLNTVSRHHATIEQEAAGYTIRDQGSLNGLLYKGRRVDRRVLCDGDIIRISDQPGNLVSLVYRDPSRPVQSDPGLVRLDALNIQQTIGDTVLLHDTTLSLFPRELVAIVGGSGTGKTTLLDALSGVRPASAGQVLINGEEPSDYFEGCRQSMGYVPQDDIIHRQLTVEQTLYYAARLRLSSDLPDKEIAQRLSQVLESVDMSESRHTRIDRLSGGQRKRVSIAVELLSQPGLFFLDEPTTGLDPGLDKRMMLLLRHLADEGRTIVLVTHATANIMVCDHVAILARGGRLCFFGPPQDALAFFEVREFADIYARLEQPPAEDEPSWEERYQQSLPYQVYVVERTGGEGKAQGSEARDQRTEAEGQESAAGPSSNQDNKATAPLSPALEEEKGAGDERESPGLQAMLAPLWHQWVLLTRRYAQIVLQSRVNLAMMFGQALIIGGIVGLVSQPTLFADGTNPIEAQKILFVLAIAGVLLGANNAAREITRESPIYRRERLINVRIVPYIFSKVLVLAAIGVAQSVLLVGVALVWIGRPPPGAFLPGTLELMISVWLTIAGGIAMGLLISSLVASSDKATSMIPLLLVPQIILAGLIFPLEGSTEALSYAVVSKWSTDSLGTTVDLNRLYYQHISSAPPGIRPLDRSIAAMNYEPENYDASTRSRPSYTEATHARSRRVHLAIRWSILAGMAALFLGITCVLQKRKG